LADSTHTPARSRQRLRASATRSRRRSRALAALAVAAAVAASTLAAPPPAARADGDPASDVLASQTLFLPADGGIPAAAQRRLAGLLSSAQRAGYPIRVALIATPSDLGSITELWRRPAEYARFLDQELSLVYRGAVLVAMPGGFGVAAAGGLPASAQTALAAAPAPGSRAGLASAATVAVQHLAASAGHPVQVPRVTSSGTPAPWPTTDAGAWAALAAGLALIAAAWTASLRSRPLGAPGQPVGGSSRGADTSTAS
jgi:hypothetical protein